jgi:hypothetical protein
MMRNERRRSSDRLGENLALIISLILLARMAESDWASTIDRLIALIAAFTVLAAVLLALRAWLQRRRSARIRREYHEK